MFFFFFFITYIIHDWLIDIFIFSKDLFVTCDNGTFEIWKNTVDKGFVFSRSGQLPENSGPISFADMGIIDIIINFLIIIKLS